VGHPNLVRFGLGLLARSIDGITITGTDNAVTVVAPGFDNAHFFDSSVPEIEFAVFHFSQPVDINDIIVDDVVNADRSIWAAGGNVAPNLSGNLLNAFPGYHIVNSSDDAGDGIFVHHLSGFSSLTYLAVGALPQGTGNTGPFQNTGRLSEFWITGLNVSLPPQAGAGQQFLNLARLSL
jgi:hypothetical protein